MRLSKRFAASMVAAATAVAGLGATIAPSIAHAEPASDLMISVYIEGSGNNKAIELHNPTSEPLELSGYTVQLFSNGNASPTNTLSLPAGELPAGGHFVIVNSQASAELAALADISHAVTNYNGDDALTLSREGTVIDSLGQVGARPSPAWTNADGTVSMLDMTLTNRSCEVDADPTDEYDPAVNFTASAQNDFGTLGTVNCSGVEPGDEEEEEEEQPEPELLAIGEVQGETDTSPYAGQTVVVEGTVTASYQGNNGFTGFYLQDAGDDNPATSDGVFVYAPGQPIYDEGHSLRVTGQVSEFFGQTQITAGTRDGLIEALETPVTVEPTVVDLPVTDWERYEGMLLSFPQDLVIVEYFEYGRYGEIVLATDRQYQPTHLMSPGEEALSLQAAQERHRIRLDDGRGNQNPSPAIHPDGQEFTLEHYFRGGDTLSGVTGVMSYRNDAFKLQPTSDWFAADYEATNPRGGMPELAGDFHVASFNVLNYFTTLGSRGAVDAGEFERQQLKIVSAIAEIDADVVGLIEIENNGTAVENLVAALNAHLGSEVYAAINTGVLGSDEIVQAFIYQVETTEPVGDWAAYDPDDGRNRPALTQRFRHLASGEEVAVSVNHLKSKGSACEEDGPGYNSGGAGNCNLTRVEMVQDMLAWFDANGFLDERLLIMGDLNSYAMEEPIQALVEAGFTDFERNFQGTSAYGYVFDGRAGYLDYAMGNAAALADTVDTVSWHINADEATLLDYQLRFKQPAEQELWAADPFRSSDHDPVVVALQLGEVTPEPEPTPTPEPTPDPTPSPSPSPSTPPTRPGLPSTGA